MIVKKLWAIVLLVLAFNVKAQSLSTMHEPLILDEHLVSAMVLSSFNYQMALSGHRIDQRDSQWWASLLPSANASITHGLSRHVFTEEPNPMMNPTNNEWITNLSIGADLNIAAANLINIPIIMNRYRSNQITHEQALTEIINGIVIQFYNLLAFGQQLNVLQSTVNVSLLAYNQALAAYNSGLVDRVSMLNAQYQYQLALTQLNRARTSFEGNMLTFKQMLGVPLERPVELRGSINVVNVQLNGDRIAATYLDSTATMQIANLNANSASLRQWLVLSSIVNPFVSLGYEMGRTRVGADNPFNPWRDSASLRLGLQVNLSYQNFNNWRNVVDGNHIQQAILANTREVTRIQIINNANNLNNLQAAITMAEQNVAISRESLTLTQVGFNQGLRTQTELQSAITNVQNAELALLQSRLDYTTSLLNLAALVGVEPAVLIRQAGE
ncbi:MAG: TolC family protein [Spirochaetaceae bacterium]|nr:TolC family protein [Spirochaetaceae bacterium]